MDNSKPLTPDTFINNNLPTIKKIFPSLVGGDNTMPGLIAGLEDQVWQVMGKDPVLQKIGREKYNTLPEGQKLKLLEDAVVLLDAAHEANKFLKKSPSS